MTLDVILVLLIAALVYFFAHAPLAWVIVGALLVLAALRIFKPAGPR